MAKKKILATAELFLDTKHAQSDANKFVTNIKQKLIDIETAADKFTVFKDMVDYISQVDKALAGLKSQNSDVFAHMFDGLDEGLRKQLEDVFGMTKEQLGTLDQLKQKISDIKQSGTATGTDLKPIEDEVKSLYEAVGAIDKLDITGKGKVETRIKKIEAALMGFASVFDDVVNKLGQGFNVGGTGVGGTVDSGIKTLVDNTEKDIQNLKQLKKDAKKALKDFYSAFIYNQGSEKMESIKKSFLDAVSFNKKGLDAASEIFKKLESGKITEDQASAKMNNLIDIQAETADYIAKHADEIEYGKQKIVKAWKDYYRAVEEAKNKGKNVQQDEKTLNMDKAYASIEDMLDKWGVDAQEKFEIMSIGEYIVDGDINVDEIGRNINKLFEEQGIALKIPAEDLLPEASDISNSMTRIKDTVQQASTQIASDVKDATKTTLDTGDAFKELVKYISNSGQKPGEFFKALESGALSLNDELKELLTNMQLLDENGQAKFSSIQTGYSNSGGMISDDLVLISRKEDKLPFSLEAQQKSSMAKLMGANIGAVLEVYKDEANGLIYELQNKVDGIPIIDFEHSIVNTDFLEATEEQIQKFVTDLQILKDSGLFVDWNGSNVLFDSEKGFSFIDFFTNSVEPYTVGMENGVQENLNMFFDTLFKKFTNFYGGVSEDMVNFKNKVEGFVPDVSDQTKAQEELIDTTNDVIAVTNTTSDSLKNESLMHENNTAAINEENKALQALIDLKTQAQNLPWHTFALDDSLSEQKSIAGFQTLGDLEKFWKQANYDKKINFYELSPQETDDTIDALMDEDLRERWYSTQEDFAAKTEIENAILANDELRNAAMNKLYQVYKKYVDSAIAFDEFLNTEFTVFRGDDHPKIYGEEQLLSFSFQKSTGRSFANNIETTTIIPKETLGSVVIPSMQHETEVFVPSSKLPYVTGEHDNFDEYYKGLFTEDKKALDSLLVQLEAQRVKSLLGSNVINRFHQASAIPEFQNKVLNQLIDGSMGEVMPQIGDYGDADAFADTYNIMSDVEKQLIAYYAHLNTLREAAYYVAKKDHKSLSKSGIVDAVVTDSKGLKGHVNNLTNEPEFNLFGQGGHSYTANTNVLNEHMQKLAEAQKIEQLKQQSTQAYNSIVDKLTEQVDEAEQEKSQALSSLLEDIELVYITQQKQLTGEISQDVLSQGLFQDDFTGELLDYNDLKEKISKIEAAYGESYQYVSDYLSEAFSEYLSSIVVDSEAVPTNFADIQTALKSQVAGLQNLANFAEDSEELKKFIYQKSDLDFIKEQFSILHQSVRADDPYLQDGMFMNQDTGEMWDVSYLIKCINDYEQEYGEDLKFVSDYINNLIASHANSKSDAIDNTIIDFTDVENKLLSDLTATMSGGFGTGLSQYDHLDYIWDAISGVHNTALNDENLINNGEFVHKGNGAVLSVVDLLESIGEYETTYGENLQYVKDYINQVFEKYNSQIEAFLQGENVSFIEPSESDLSTMYSDVENKLVDKLVDLKSTSAYGTGDSQADYLDDLYYAVAGAYKTAIDDEKLIDNGDFVHQATGEVLNVSDLLGAINHYESNYGENLQYVKDFVNKVFAKCNAEYDQLFNEAKDVINQLTSDDELILDGFELSDDDIYDNNKKDKVTSSDFSQQQAYVNTADVESETSVLDGLLVKINEVKKAVQDKTQAFIEEGTIVDVTVNDEIGFLNQLLDVLEQVSANVNNIIAGYQQINDMKLSDDDTPIDDTTRNTDDSSHMEYALDTTVQETNSILNEISNKIENNQSLADIVTSLNNAVTELKNVANGIIQHQKHQQTDKAAASAKIANSYGQLTDISSNAVSSLGDDIQVKQMKALADGVVRVEGAVRKADGAWKGFTVDIDDANNAVIRAVDEHSTFANVLNQEAEAAKMAAEIEALEQAEKAKKENPQYQLQQAVKSQIAVFNTYRKSLEGVDYINNEVTNGFSHLATRIQAISSMDDLNEWKRDFEALRNEISTAQTVFSKLESDKIQKIRGQVNSEFKNLDFMTTTSNPTAEQKEILDIRSKLLAQLEEYKLGIKEGKAVELSSINETLSALHQKIQAYREVHELTSGGGQKFGATAVLNATAKYNSLKQEATGVEFGGSKVVQQAFQEYEAAYNRLLAKRKELSQVEGSLNDTQKSDLKQLQTECNNYAKILAKIITDSKKLKAESVGSWSLGEDFDDTDAGRKQALIEFVDELYGSKAKIEEFRNNFNQLVFSVNNGDGTFTEMTASVNAARTSIDAIAGSTKKATGIFESFINELKGKFKSIGAYLIASFGFQEIWQQLRQGFNYVREIDSALTELKKVTNETDAAYGQFLQDMSKTAGVVGSTVKDLTTMSAEWARLGSIIKSAPLYSNIY